MAGTVLLLHIVALTLCLAITIDAACIKPTPDTIVDTQPGGVEVKEIAAAGRAEAFERDCQLVARQFGWEIAATRTHMQNQALFGDLVTKLQTRYSKIYAGSVFSREPGKAASIYLKGDQVSEPRCR